MSQNKKPEIVQNGGYGANWDVDSEQDSVKVNREFCSANFNQLDRFKSSKC